MNQPRISPYQRHILVIGAGVSGLTTAFCLQQHGFQVTIVAEKFAPFITSVVAGALWEWPPAVCGYHHDQISLSRSKEWCMVSYEKFTELSQNAETGVFIRPVIFYFNHLVKEFSQDLHKMNELKNKVSGFSHNSLLIEDNGVNGELGLKDAYTYLAPMVDTDRYIAWLMKEVKSAGAPVIAQRIEGNIIEQEEKFKKEFKADIIVNCSGLGASELAGEYMYPLRGALVRVHNDGTTMPRITKAHCISHDETRNEQDIIFIVPRGKDMVLLGGLAEADKWNTDIGLDNYQPIKDMFERCVKFLPILKYAKIDAREPVRVGLRPFRNANVRLEREQETYIIHNYGHGGAGVTFSWGCAMEVVKLIEGMDCLKEG